MKSIKIFFTTFSLLFTVSMVYGQHGLSTSAGARGIGIGNSNLVFKDIYSGFNNQAGLAYLDNFSGAVFVENKFLLKELQFVGLSIAQPTNSGTWGMTLNYFGFTDYNEQKVGLSYSRILFDKLAIGAQFDFLNTRITEYGNANGVTFEIGLQYEILDKLMAGAHVYNPIRTTIGDEELPSIIQIGLTYSLADYITISGAIEKDTNLPYNIKVGAEYQIFEKVDIRVGMNSNPNRFSFGLGYMVNNIQLNAAATYHDILGFSPSFGLSFLPEDGRGQFNRLSSKITYPKFVNLFLHRSLLPTRIPLRYKESRLLKTPCAFYNPSTKVCLPYPALVRTA